MVFKQLLFSVAFIVCISVGSWADVVPSPRPGEIELIGSVVKVDTSSRTLELNAESVTFPDGTGVHFPAMRSKTVVIDQSTTITRGKTVLHLADLVQGAKLEVIGKDTKTGQPLHARFIEIPGSDSNAPTVGTAPTITRQEANAKEPDGYTPLENAAMSSDSARIRELIAAGADVRADPSAFYWCIKNCDAASYMEQSSAGAGSARDGLTPLMLAAIWNKPIKAKALIDSGAGVNDKDNFGHTALMWAASSGSVACINALTRAGVDTNAKADFGMQAIIVAARTGHADCLRALLAAGADPNAKDGFSGDTPLMQAARKGYADCVTALISAGANVKLTNVSQDTALADAAVSGNIDCIRAIANAGADLNEALRMNVSNGRASSIRPLVEAGANLGKGDLLGVANANEYADCVEALIDAGENPADGGITPLMLASMKGDDGQVRSLLASGADVNAWDHEGRTAVEWASIAGKKQCVDTLIAAGADVNARCQIGETPVYCAVRKGQLGILRSLVIAGANGNLADINGYTPLMECSEVDFANLLIAAHVNLNAQNSMGETALFDDIMFGRRKIIHALIAAGADVNIPNKQGKTPLALANGWGQTAIASELTAAGAH